MSTNKSRPIIPWRSTFINNLVPTMHGDFVVVDKYRPKSSQIVHPNRHTRILPTKTTKGVRSTKTSTLRELCSAQKPILTPTPRQISPNFPHGRSMRNNAWMSPNANISKSNDEDVVEDGVDVVSCGTNTDPTWWSIDRWHGAEWQCKLPKMYLPRKFHRDCNNSVVVRSKTVKSRWRNADEMPGKGELGSKLSNQDGEMLLRCQGKRN